MGYDLPLNASLNLANGNHLLWGNATDAPFGMVRIDASGNVLWGRSIGSMNDGYLENIVETPDRSLIGAMVTPGGPIIFCLDSLGDELWAETMAAGGVPLGFPQVTTTTDDAYTLHVHAPYPDTTDLVIKFDDTGAVIWARQVVTPGAGYHICQRVVQMEPDGLLLLTGQGGIPAIARVDGSGAPQWYWEMNLGAGDWGVAEVAQLSNNDLFVAYVRSSFAGGPEDLVVGRLDVNGQAIWHEAFDPVGPLDILPGTDGMVAVSDGAVLGPRDPLRMRFMRIDTSGTVDWMAHLPTNNIASSIASAGNDSIWALTYQFSTIAVTEWHRIATDQPPSGCLGTEAIPLVPCFATQTAGTFSMVDVPVTITPYALDTHPIPVTTVQLCTSTGMVEALRGGMGIGWAPGPSDGSVNVDFTVEGEAFARLVDMRGAIMRRATFRSLTTGQHRYQMRLEGLPAGVYVFELSNGRGARECARLAVQ